MAGVIAHPGELGDHYRDPLQGPQVGVEPIRHRPSHQRLLDLGQLGIRQPWIGTGRVPAAQRIRPAWRKAGVPEVGALAGHAELAGDLGLAAALGEQFGGTKASDLTGGTLIGRTEAADGGYRRSSHTISPAVNPTHELNILSFRSGSDANGRRTCRQRPRRRVTFIW
jgi:hypothetical protein